MQDECDPRPYSRLSPTDWAVLRAAWRGYWPGGELSSDEKLEFATSTSGADVRGAHERGLLTRQEGQLRPSILGLYYLAAEDEEAAALLEVWKGTFERAARAWEPGRHRLQLARHSGPWPPEAMREMGNDVHLRLRVEPDRGWTLHGLKEAHRHGTLDRAIASQRLHPASTPASLPGRPPFDLHLKRIDLVRFRGLRRLEMSLESPLTILVGLNGAGKSTVLDAVAFTAAALREGLPAAVSREGPTLARMRTRGAGGALEVGLGFDADIGAGLRPGEYRFRVDDVLGRLSVEEERLTYGEEATEWLVGSRALASVRRANGDTEEVYGGVDELKLAKLSDDAVHSIPMGLRHALQSVILVDRDPFLEPAPTRNDFVRSKPRARRRLTDSPRDVLAACIENQSVADALGKAVSTFIPTIRGVRSVIEESGRPPELLVEEVGSSVPARLEELSAGMRQMLLLAALYVHPEPPVTILLEEPDAALHVGAIPALRDLLRSLSERANVIATSHRPELVQHFDPSTEVQVLRRSEEGAEVLPFAEASEQQEWLRSFDPREAFVRFGSER